MRKTLLFALLLILGFGLISNVYAQVNVTIGSGTSTNTQPVLQPPMEPTGRISASSSCYWPRKSRMPAAERATSIQSPSMWPI